MNNTLPNVACHVDWLTLTCTDATKRASFLDLCSQLLDHAIPKSTPVKPWRWKGYAGLNAGKLTFGQRDDSAIVQLSSDWADIYGSGFYDLSTNCSRIDLAATLPLEGRIGGYIKRHYAEALAHKHQHRPTLSVNAVLGDGEWETVYIGSRISDLFGRIYDKHRESGLPEFAGHLRYELEIKGQPAEHTFTALSATADRAAWVGSAVHKYFADRGVRPKYGGVDPNVCIKTVRPVSDDATRLAYLGTNVRPTVERLLSVYRPAQILAALGFPRSVSELYRLSNLIELDKHRDLLREEETGD